MIDEIWSNRGIIEKFSRAYGSGGVRECVIQSWDVVYRKILYLTYPVYKNFLKNRNKYFGFNGKYYRYCTDIYNLAWRNERTVEIPLIADIVRSYSNKCVLEVGNVLAHYIKDLDKRTVVDLYEKWEGVTNTDITEYFPRDRFDLIISISTMEHVGLEDGLEDPTKAINAIHHCVANCLVPGGLLVITVPVGYNKHLDRAIYEDRTNFENKCYLLRIKGNEWVEVPDNMAVEKDYGKPYICANALFVGTMRRN